MFLPCMHYSAYCDCISSFHPSLCDVGGSGPHRLEILETNCTPHSLLYPKIGSSQLPPKTPQGVRDGTRYHPWPGMVPGTIPDPLWSILPFERLLVRPSIEPFHVFTCFQRYYHYHFPQYFHLILRRCFIISQNILPSFSSPPYSFFLRWGHKRCFTFHSLGGATSIWPFLGHFFH